MAEGDTKTDWRSTPFEGEVGEPYRYSTPRFDHDLVSFRIRPLRGVLRKGVACLVSESGQERQVTVVTTSTPTPSPDALDTWQAGDAMVFLDGITVDEAQGARLLRQDLPESTPRISTP